MSTTDTALLLLLRFGLGRMLAAHGVNKVFGPGGLDGPTRWFAGLGFRPAWLPQSRLPRIGADVYRDSSLLH